MRRLVPLAVAGLVVFAGCGAAPGASPTVRAGERTAACSELVPGVPLVAYAEPCVLRPGPAVGEERVYDRNGLMVFANTP